MKTLATRRISELICCSAAVGAILSAPLAFAAPGDPQVTQLWYMPAVNKWVPQDVTGFAGHPLPHGATDVSAFDAADGQHVFYITASQDIAQLWFDASIGKWLNQDLTVSKGAPIAILGTGVASFTIADGEHIFYVTNNQHLEQLFFSFGTGQWSVQDLTMTWGGPLVSMDSKVSAFAGIDGQHVFYTSANVNDMEHFFFDPASQQWVNKDLTSVYGAPQAEDGTHIAGFDIDDGLHVYYVTSGNHLEQLYFSFSASTWYPQDLSRMTGGPSTSGIRGVSAFAIADGQHVFYADLFSGNMQQLFYRSASKSWVNQDLTTTWGAPPAAFGSISSFAIADGQHVYYLTANDMHVEQLYFPSTNKWIPQDLTQLAGAAPASAGVGLSAISTNDGQHVYYISPSP
jgi:hypothetical protein